MPFFASAAEVDCYVGGVLRLAATDPVLGPQLARAAMTLRLSCTDLPAHLVLDLRDPVAVVWNGIGVAADVELHCDSDVLDGVLRGEVDVVDALARGVIHARGQVSKALKVLPVLEQAYPFYRQLVAVKERATSDLPGVLP
ncbi:SCP2 sterol-binding domain-containing protein [Nocardioides sp. J54]|uniref:SCP2 sterol-binding domain-containing protein n=1 Tax=Nocardioides sp. J54 TaxID=935866 RepID=UPI0004903EAC|nr:SCP2 sterol-binding domain-containing protein [Nocardioides sp. J54]